MKQVEQDGLIYLINEKEEKAEIIQSDDRSTFLIPRLINYESHEYVVVSILKNAFRFHQHLESIEFASDSELQTIEEGAFDSSLIESIFIPASVIDLKEGWCLDTIKLKKIDVDPRNPRYSNYEGKMIICKNTETSENYDKIVFCRRDITEITIPSFIKIIGSYSFSKCEQLKRIDIPTNSELQTIEANAFSWSSIERIFIPIHVTKISKEAFFYCRQLQQIDIPANSELQTIECEAFSMTSIERMFIPANVNDLKNGWCRNMINLSMIYVDPRNPRYLNYEDKMIICKTSEASENYDKIVFCQRYIEEIAIPSFIKTIGSSAFECCVQIQRIDIPINSELQTIEDWAFAGSSIESIFIPPHVTKISKEAFCYCQMLQRIDIPTNSELQTIETNAFLESSIESIYIPASVIDLKDGWCNYIKKLTKVQVDPNNSRYSYLDGKMIICKTSKTSENYDKIVFCRQDIKETTIPSFIKTIGPIAFQNCQQLQRIDISMNSELQIIEKGAFARSSIESIFIPSHVARICEDAFMFCEQLRRIDIPLNSKLQIIEQLAFYNSSIKSIFIPPQVTKICSFAFSGCKQLQRINFTSNSKLQIIEEGAFQKTSIKSIFIPPHVTKICKLAFSECEQLQRINFSSNSKLQIIESCAFFGLSIRKIFIPPHVTKIGTKAFSCFKLQRIDIPSNSELQTIQKDAFAHSSINSIFIPPRVTYLDKDAFSFCRELKLIEINEISKIKLYDINTTFLRGAIIMIPFK